MSSDFLKYMVMSLDPLGTRRPDFKLFGYGTNWRNYVLSVSLKRNLMNTSNHSECTGLSGISMLNFLPFRHKYTEM